VLSHVVFVRAYSSSSSSSKSGMVDTAFLISIDCTKKILKERLDERFTREDWKKKNLEEEEEDFYSPSRRRHTFSFLVRTKNEIVIDERESNPQSSPSSVT